MASRSPNNLTGVSAEACAMPPRRSVRPRWIQARPGPPVYLLSRRTRHNAPAAMDVLCSALRSLCCEVPSLSFSLHPLSHLARSGLRDGLRAGRSAIGPRMSHSWRVATRDFPKRSPITAHLGHPLVLRPTGRWPQRRRPRAAT